MVIALKNIGQPEHDRGKVLGIAVRVHAVAHDTDTGDGGVKGCGGDHLAVPVSLKPSPISTYWCSSFHISKTSLLVMSLPFASLIGCPLSSK